MARIDYKVGVTPIESTAAGTAGGPMETETISHDFQKSLGGGDSSLTWAGNTTSEWVAGVHEHLQSRSSDNTITTSGSDGLWIKHTGYKYDGAVATDKSSTAETTTVVIVSCGAQEVCRLKSGQAIFLPDPKDATWTLTDDAGGDAVAVEYANFT